MNCTYKLNVGGEVMSFNSITELNAFITNNYSKIKNEVSSLAVYELDVTNIVRGAKSIDGISEEGKVTVYDFIKNQRDSDGKRLIPEVLEEEHKENFIKWQKSRLMQENISIEEDKRLSSSEIDEKAEKSFNELKEDNEIVRDFGITVHKYIKGYLNDPKGAMARIYQDLANVPNKEESYRTIKKQLSDIAYNLNSKGDVFTDIVVDSEIIKEIKGKTVKVDSCKIKDKIDIVVIETRGTGKQAEKVAHIYDIMLSKKDYSNWDSAKILTEDYKLAALKQMLGMKGVNVTKTQPHIIPVKVELSSTKNEKGDKILDFSKFVIDSPDNRKATKREFDTRIGLGVKGAITRKINELLPYDIPKTALNYDVSKVKIVRNTLQRVFGTGYKLGYDVDYFIKNHLKQGADKTWYFTDDSEWEKTPKIELPSISPKLEASKDHEEIKSILETNSEVLGYLKGKERKIVETVEEHREKIIQTRDDDDPDTAITDNIKMSSPEVTARFRTLYKEYTEKGYKVLDIELLQDFGIMAFYNEDNIVDFIDITVRDLKYVYNLSGGEHKNRDSILGNFEENDWAIKQGINNIAKSDTANNETIKVMTLLNNYPEIFTEHDLKLGKITIVNATTGLNISPDLDQMLEGFDTLRTLLNRVKESPEVVNNFNKEIKIANKSEVIFKKLHSIAYKNLSNPNKTPDKKLENVLKESELKDFIIEMTENKYDIEEKNNKILEIEEEFLKAYPEVLSDKVNVNNDIAYIYHLISALKMEYNRLHYYSEPDLKYFGIRLNGYMISNPDNIPSMLGRGITSMISASYNIMSRRYMSVMNDVTKYTRGYYETKGYSTLEQFTIGNPRKHFAKLYVRNDKGNLNDNFMFINPYSKNGNNKVLDESEEEYLKDMLWELNKYRIKEVSTIRKTTRKQIDEKIKNFDKLSEKDKTIVEAVIESRENNDYFLAPIKEGDAYSKAMERGVEEHAKMIFKDLKHDFNNLKDNLDTFEETRTRVISDGNSKFVNKYNRTHDQRKKIIDNNGVGTFELNIEELVLENILETIREEELDKSLKVMNNVLFNLKYANTHHGVDNDNLIKYLEMIKKTHILGTNIDDEETSRIRPVTSTMKMVTSTITLGLSPVALVREVMQGTWSTVSRSMVNYYGKETFGLKEYGKALSIMIGDDTKAIGRSTTLIESLNHHYTMANMDPSQWIEKTKTNRQGLFNFNRYLFWTSSAGDYHNRMIMFVSQMIKDGCLEAHSVDELGNLTYDFKKDKRFEKFIKNQVSDPEYNYQRALYYKKLEEFNSESAFELKEGDDLPQAYTNKEVESLKTFSNRAFGYLNEKDKALVNQHALWGLWTQFKVFWTAKLKVWLENPNTQTPSNEGNYAQIKSLEGKPLFFKYTDKLTGDTIEKSEGLNKANIITDMVEEDTGYPALKWVGKPSEGIFYSYYKTLQDVLKGDWKKSLSVEHRVANMKLGALDIMLVSAIGLALREAINALMDNRDKSSESMVEFLGLNARDWGLKGVLNLSQDSSPLVIVNSFSFIPPSVTIAQTQFNNLSSLIGGDKNFFEYMIKTIPGLK